MTTGMKNSTSNINDVGGGTYTSFSSSGKGNGVKTSSVTPSNNMVTGMTSFAEDIEFSTVKTSIVIQPSAVAPSKINSEIYSTAYFQTQFMASKMVGSIATGMIKAIFFIFSTFNIVPERVNTLKYLNNYVALMGNYFKGSHIFTVVLQVHLPEVWGCGTPHSPLMLRPLPQFSRIIQWYVGDYWNENTFDR